MQRNFTGNGEVEPLLKPEYLLKNRLKLGFARSNSGICQSGTEEQFLLPFVNNAG
ncbi:MAG TPA: hypothetical protein V6C65_19905 [Allocoleopsis sp.]